MNETCIVFWKCGREVNWPKQKAMLSQVFGKIDQTIEEWNRNCDIDAEAVRKEGLYEVVICNSNPDGVKREMNAKRMTFTLENLLEVARRPRLRPEEYALPWGVDPDKLGKSGATLLWEKMRKKTFLQIVNMVFGVKD